MSEDENKKNDNEEVGEEEEESYVDEIINELKQEVMNNGGTLPNPRRNPEFYMKLIALIEDPTIKISQKKIAEMLGVSYTLLRNRISTFRRLMEKGEIPGSPETVDVIEESALSKTLENVVRRKLVKHFGIKVDSLTSSYIDNIIKCGIIAVEKYGAWCKENGMEYSECVDKAMSFFIENKDEIEYLRNKVEGMKILMSALYKLSKRNIMKIAALELLRRLAVDLAERNPDALEYISLLLERVIGGEPIESGEQY